MSDAEAGVPSMDTGASEYEQFVRRRIRMALLLAVAASFILVLAGLKEEAKGLALGGCFSVLNFVLLSKTIPAAIARRDRTGRSLAGLWVFGRLAVMAVPLALAVKFEMFSLVTTVIGLFAIQATLLLEPIFKRLTRGLWKN